MAADLVIRGGTVVDGTGAPRRRADVAIEGDRIVAVGDDVGTGGAPYVGDVAIDGDRIVEVGKVSGTFKREIDAAGMTVTPGWVDIHTHYDGQATWDAVLAPSSWHGVTTAIMGNCGVGFAPVRPDAHNFLIELMEGVEDIPG